MPRMGKYLEGVGRCPHCKIDSPSLRQQSSLFETYNHWQSQKRLWGVYVCERCGGVLLAGTRGSGEANELYPSEDSVDEAVPSRAAAYLQQARDSASAPAGAIMLCASAVDAMLKAKGYSDGKLFGRIDRAKADNVITDGMAEWAHQVRLEANDQRHSDDGSDLPSFEEASQTIEFTSALAELLFVLPARVTRGIRSAGKDDA